MAGIASPHSEKKAERAIKDSNLLGLSVFLQHSKDMHVRLTDDSKSVDAALMCTG